MRLRPCKINGTEMVQLTHYKHSNLSISSMYGDVTYIEWLNKEKKRIESNSSRKAEIKMKKKTPEIVALFVNPVV